MTTLNTQTEVIETAYNLLHNYVLTGRTDSKAWNDFASLSA